VAVYCSDGRFAPACEKFLSDTFVGRSVDRLVLPGGPGALVHNPSHVERFAELRFLIQAHQLSRIVLIAHDGCGYYKHVLGVDGNEMTKQQVEDLLAAARLLSDEAPGVPVDLYHAKAEPGGIVIQKLDRR
jgi:carbonic anhydrase